MLKYRLTLGPTLLLALLGALWLDGYLETLPSPPWLTQLNPALGPTLPPCTVILVLGLLIVPLAARELGAIFKAGGVAASRRWMAIAAMAGLLVSAVVPSGISPVHAVALVATTGAALLVGALLWHIRRRDLKGATAAAGAAMFAFVYLGLMFGFILALRREHSEWVVLGVLIVTKSCDIGAFFTGKAIGRHKLIPWLSPGKTWEGLVGGMCLAAIVAVGGVRLARAYNADAAVAGLASWQGAALGALFALVGQAGDLLASVLKRDAGLKDSGRVLPGFGGILDVLDSVLLVAPVAFWALTGHERP